MKHLKMSVWALGYKSIKLAMLAGWNNVTAFVEAKCVCVSIKIPNFPDPKVTSSNSNKV